MHIHCFVPRGYQGHLVTVEVDIRRGIPGTEIVGLPGGAVREARERVRTAIRNCGLLYPQDRIIINLVPAGVPKTGASFDLAIALAILQASGQLRQEDADAHSPPAAGILALGELQLNGEIRPVSGVLAAVVAARHEGIRRVVVPSANSGEASITPGLQVQAVRALPDALRPFSEAPSGAPRSHPPTEAAPGVPLHGGGEASDVDFAELRGRSLVKRVAEVAAAGGHSLLLVGPPGVGKSLALSCYPGILPDLAGERAIEATRIHSIAGTLRNGAGLLRRPPVRRPHHSASREGLIGGGAMVLPGEVSLAHGGVLCLDEVLEFPPRVLQSLRQPLQDGSVTIARAGEQYWFPAEFQLVLATNPCPCGYRNSEVARCLCSEMETARYWKRLGGALLDRIELRLEITGKNGDLLSAGKTEGSAPMRERVAAARTRQRERYDGEGTNASVAYSTLRSRADLPERAEALLRAGAQHLRLSNRGVTQALRVAHTIADLDAKEVPDELCVSEALQYRRFAARWE